jgi:GNAT superfamily N-acetyltransferase
MPSTSNEAAVEIRPMTAADIEPLRALAREIWVGHYTPIIGGAQIEYMLGQRYCAPVLRAELARNDIWWDLLFVAGTMVGYSSYFVADDGITLYLDKLYIHPDRQRGGYGRRMLARATGKARSLGCTKIALAVNKRNAHAIAAYARWGFHVEASVVKDIGGGFVMDDFIMAMNL